MKMRHLWLTCFVVFACVVFNSCDKDEPEQKIIVKLTVNPAIPETFDASKISELEVSLKDMRTNNEVTGQFDALGTVMVELYKGTYNITIETKITETADGAEYDIVYSAKMENCAITTEGQEISLSLHTFPATAQGTDFIFSEVFFNGETNSGRMMHPDQYITIFNPTQEVLYADGLCVGMTLQVSCLEPYSFYQEYMSKDKVPSMGFFTIPGSGTQYPVNPGDKFVVAFTAIDHSSVEGYDNAVDLSGADFEIYIPDPDYPDADNPEVPNVIVTEDVYLHPRGYYAPFMFRLENGTTSVIEKFYSDNTEEYADPDGTNWSLFSVPTERIIDGMVSGDLPNDIITRPLPISVDRGKVIVSGCHRQELAIRKEILVGSQIFYQDTNNSEDDFVIRNGQTSYPKGWRNN